MGERAGDFKRQLAYAEQRCLYDYWRSKCRPGVLPHRKDVHPREIIQLLPFITLTDVMRENQHHAFRVRLAGTGLRTIFDTEITGCLLDDLPFGPARSTWLNVHEKIVEDRTPLCGVTPLIWHGADSNRQSALAQFWIKFPLIDENNDVSTILAYDVFTPISDLSPELKISTRN